MAKRKRETSETDNSKSSGSGMDYRASGHHISNKQLKLWAMLAPTPTVKRVFTNAIKLHKHHA